MTVIKVITNKSNVEKVIKTSTRIGPQGPPGPAASVGSSSDVDISGQIDGSILVWDAPTGKYVAQNFLVDTTIDGGIF